MQNILAIWQREMRSYFVSPIAYAVLSIFLLLSGFFSIGNLVSVIQYTMTLEQIGQGTQAMDVPQIVAQAVFKTMSVILLFLIPMLTMGLFSEEKKRGTIELLLTTPVSNFQAIMGKYLASLGFLLILCICSGITLSIVFVFGRPDWNPILSGYLGLFLYGAALLALGIFISTLTENQIVAVVITFGASLVFLLISLFSSWTTGAAKSVIDYLSISGHLDDFINGVIDTSHIIYYVTFAFVGLFLAFRSLESMRWKS